MRFLTLFVCAFGAVAFAQSDGNVQLRERALQRLERELQKPVAANEGALAVTPDGANAASARQGGLAGRLADPAVSSIEIVRECVVYMPRAAVETRIDRKMTIPAPKPVHERDTIAPPVPECAPRASRR